MSAAGQSLVPPEQLPAIPIPKPPPPIGLSAVLNVSDDDSEFGPDGMPRTQRSIYIDNIRSGCYRDTKTDFGWTMPGGLPSFKYCQKYFLNSHIHDSDAPTKIIKYCCRGLTCCKCFEPALMARAVAATKRGAAYVLFMAASGEYYGGKTQHFAITAPPAMWPELVDPLVLDKWLGRKFRQFIDEGVLEAVDGCVHPWRFTHKKKRRKFQPHGHALCWEHIPNEQYEPEINYNRNDRKLRDLSEFDHAFRPAIRINRQKLKVNRDIEARSRPLTDNLPRPGYDFTKIRINGKITKVSLDALRSLLAELIPENRDRRARIAGTKITLGSDEFKALAAGDPVAAGLRFSIVTVGAQRAAAIPVPPELRTNYEMFDPVSSVSNEIGLRDYLQCHVGLHPGVRDLGTGKHKKHNAPMWRHYGKVANVKIETCISNWNQAVPALIGNPKSIDKSGSIIKPAGLTPFLFPGGKPLDSVKVTAAALPHELTSLDYGKIVLEKAYKSMSGHERRRFTSLMPSFECSPEQFLARLPGMLTRAGVVLAYPAPKKNGGDLQTSAVEKPIKITPLPSDGPMSRLLRTSFQPFPVSSVSIKPGKPPPMASQSNNTPVLMDILRLQTLHISQPVPKSDYLVLLIEGRRGKSVRRCAVFVDPSVILLCPCCEKLQMAYPVNGKLPDEMPLPGIKGSDQLVVIPSHKLAYYDQKNVHYSGVPVFNHSSRTLATSGIKEVPSYYNKLELAAQIPIRNEIVYSAAKWAARHIKQDIERQAIDTGVFVKTDFKALMWTALDYMHSEPLPKDLAKLASRSLVAGVWRAYADNEALLRTGDSVIPPGFELTLAAFGNDVQAGSRSKTAKSATG